VIAKGTGRFQGSGESTTIGDLGKYVSQAEAARIIGTTNQTVANLIRRGQFTTVTVAGRVLILRAEAEKYVARPKGGSLKKLFRRESRGNQTLRKTQKEGPETYISQAEAARIREVSQQAIVNLIRRGRLRSVNIASRTLLYRTEVEAFVASPKTGRPPKKKTTTGSHKKTNPKN
jgi:predicted DNA-binding protein (UPF0251 family)